MPTDRKRYWKPLAIWWLTKCEKLFTTQGPIQTIKLIKSARLHVTRYLCGEPLFQSAIPCLGLNARGLPRMIGPLQTLLDGDHWDKRFLMTLLLISRTIKGHGKPDHSSITNPQKGSVNSELLTELRSVIPSWFKPIDTEWQNFHLTTRMGPNGQALISSTLDLKYLTAEQLDDIKLIGGEKLFQIMEVNRRWLSLDYGSIFTVNDRGSTRNISYVYDPEAKVRVIAILDYWTQTACEEISKGLFNLLKSFPSDCTFDQGSRLWQLKPEDKFYSMDLSSATDRFPLKVQEFILAALIGDDKAAAWARLMAGQPFRSPEGNLLRYEVGQPMGARSSWSAFTLCHHLVVLAAAKRAGKNPELFSNYMLLGDDIVIADCSVAKHYRAIMTSLGVDISEVKTHTSKDTYEFAKRWIHKGLEITGAPIRGLLENANSAFAPVVFLETLEDRWATQALISRSSVLSLIRIMQSELSYPKAAFLAKRAYELYIIPRTHDTMEQKSIKAFKCYDTLLFRYLGCTISEERIWLVLNQLIPMIRIGMIEKAIKEAFQSVVAFRQKAVMALLKGNVPEIGLSQEQAIQTADLHPSVAVGLTFVRDQQGQIDQMNQWIETGVEEKVLDFPPTIGFHPEKAFLQSREQAQSDIRSKIPKGVKTLVKMGINRCTIAKSTDNPTLLQEAGIDLALMDLE